MKYRMREVRPDDWQIFPVGSNKDGESPLTFDYDNASEELKRLNSETESQPLKLEGTMKAPCAKPCCGCLILIWVADESAYQAKCNECGEAFGWFKSDWSDMDDRSRLGGDGNI